MSREVEVNQRSHLRQTTKLAARHRWVSPEEAAEFRSHLALRGPITGSKVEPELVDHLGRLERKLDYVLSLILPDYAPPLLGTQAREVELSGGGFGYMHDEAVEEGTEVLCELLLPGVPPHQVRAIARVILCRASGTAYQLGFEFESIDERDRDSIVRFVNRVQLVERHAAD